MPAYLDTGLNWVHVRDVAIGHILAAERGRVGERYILRIRQLIAAPDLQTLYALRALDFHPLTGDRAGQHALRLTGRMRLIVTIEDERTIRIEEVVDYHG